MKTNHIIGDSKKFEEALSALVNTMKEKEKITQECIAKKIGVTKNTLSKWLNNQSRPNSDNIEKILQVFNVQPEDIGVSISNSNFESEDMKNFTDQFFAILKKNGTPIKEFADKAGIPVSTLQNYLKRKCKDY